MYEIEELLKDSGNFVCLVNNGNGKKLSWSNTLERWVAIPNLRGKNLHKGVGQFDTTEEAIKELLKED